MTVLVILDTNVFVAAGFRPASASGRLLDLVRRGGLRMVWSGETRRETLAVLGRIPRLDADAAAPLFRPEEEHAAPLDLEGAAFVADPADRKFAALARATGATLATADDHLLAHRARLDVLTPTEFLRDRLDW